MTAKGNTVRLPTEEETRQAQESSRTLAKYTDAERVSVSLRGSNGETDDLVLPGHVLQILLDALAEMAQGNAISLVPYHQEIGTQQAAGILNVSRPHLVKLLENGTIPFHKVGSHRRVLLRDLLAYQEQQVKQRSEALDELASLSQQNNMGY